MSSAEVAGVPFPVAHRTQWSHLVRRPLLVGASLRGFAMVAKGSSDEPTVHTRAIQHFHTSRGQDLEWDSWPVSHHIESLCRHRRMALEKLTPLTSESKTCSRDWDEESLVRSLVQCVVDASLELALAARFA